MSEQTTVHVHRAGRIGDTAVPALYIAAEREVSDGLSLEDARALYEREGAQIAFACFRHLPGGTLDQLLAELLQLRASQLRVTLWQPESPEIELAKCAFDYFGGDAPIDPALDSDLKLRDLARAVLARAGRRP